MAEEAEVEAEVEEVVEVVEVSLSPRATHCRWAETSERLMGGDCWEAAPCCQDSYY